MRHRVAGRRLSRTKEHRLAMRRNLVASLIQHETVSTTIEKAKEVKPFAEKLITLAKKGTLAARRRAIALLGNRDIVDYEDGQAVKAGTIIGKLFSELGPRYLDRPGGYTRIIRLSLRRSGDNGHLVLLQLIGADETLEKKDKTKAKKRSRKKAKETVEVKEIDEARESFAECLAWTEDRPEFEDIRNVANEQIAMLNAGGAPDCNSPEACHALAEERMGAGEIEGAIAAIEHGIGLVPENEHPPYAQFWCLKGEAHLALEQFEMAIWSFEDCMAWTEGEPDPGLEDLRVFAQEQIDMINNR